MSTLLNNIILVVDDDADTCELLRFVLEESGASIVVAHSVDAALEAFHLNHADVKQCRRVEGKKDHLGTPGNIG